MGEVRVKAVLTNAIDEGLAHRGQISPTEIRRYEADAMVDTGAVRSVVPSHVAQRLGLASRGQRIVEYGDGRKEAVDIIGPLVINILDRDTLEETLVFGDEILVGRTVLNKLDIVVDCNNHRVIPNPAHPDQPVTKVK
ncbi:MAG TPA: aspartyl protease family protein [Pyrinomonadaceae bacterium]|jgi:clan AA aspartic protease|nr:aspartyl protease family protein [Pyrinomonadaceae bacterium]